MAIEEAKYTVLKKVGAFELRQYEAKIVAETFVEGDFSKVGSTGFRRLFGYISGNNRTDQKNSDDSASDSRGGFAKDRYDLAGWPRKGGRQVENYFYHASSIQHGNAS